MSETAIVFEQAEGWRILALLAVIGLAWGCGYLGLRGTLSTGRRFWLLTLRGLSLLGLLLLLLGPAIEERELKPLASRLVFLLDQSMSMGLPAGAVTRAERIRVFLEQHRTELDALRSEHRLELLGFDSRLSPEPVWGEAVAGGQASDLIGSLSVVLPTKGKERDLAGVVLVSDGADTEVLAGLPFGGALPESVKNRLAECGVPVNTLTVGGDSPLADLAITDVKVDGFAFIRNAVEVEVSILAQGLPALSVPLSLEQGGRLLSSQTVALRPGHARKVKLKIVPDRVGDFVFRVSVAA